MGGNNSTIDRHTLTNIEEGKVMMYSKENFQGNVYEVDYGNYTSSMFVKKISPDNVFSLSIPRFTSIKMYSGDMYDYGGKGFMQIVNVTNDRTDVPSLPQNIRGSVRSLTITKHNNASLNTSTQSNTVSDLSNPFSNEQFTSDDKSKSEPVNANANVTMDYFCNENQWTDSWSVLVIIMMILFSIMVTR